LSKLAEIPEDTRVYVDESGCNEFYCRDKGRAPRGKKVQDTRRGRKYGRTNVVAGYCAGKILAQFTYNKTTNSALFENWFEYDLLTVAPSGYTVIMDNASFHRKKKLREIADRYSVSLLFLPPYSPDFNPIEKYWSNMKKWLKKTVTSFPSIKDPICVYGVRILF
jgi:transposase